MNHLSNYHLTRDQKARKILLVLQDFLGTDLQNFSVIDVGCADGSITHALADHFHFLVGSDIDQDAIRRTARFNRPDLSFIIGDGSSLAIADCSVDVAICAQVYEHTEDQFGLADEIWRVLRPGGVCFFSGPNRLAIMEEHYWLPFLSWMPRPLAHLYMRVAKKGTEYDIKPMYPWQVRRLWQNFEQHDYTEKILKNPQKFAMDAVVGRFARITAHLPSSFLRLMKVLIPNYNWILVKSR